MAGVSQATDASAVIAALQRQRRVVVDTILWVILAIALVTFAVNAVLLGRDVLSFQASAPNALLILTVLASLWLNRRGQVVAATLLTTGLILIAAAIPVLVVGIDGNAVALLLFFIPVVMAGLLLDRLALSLVAGLSMLVVLLGPILAGEPFRPGDAAGTDETWGLVLQFQLVFATVTFLLDRVGYRYQESLRSALGERVRAERELRREKNLTDAIIQSLPGLFYVRDADGRIVQWNAEFQRLTGYDDAEIGQLEPTELFEDDGQAPAAGSPEVLEQGVKARFVRVRAKDGSTTPFFISGTATELAGERYLVCVGIDRSEIDSAQAEIQGLNVELTRRLERLTALGEIDRAIIGSLDLDLTLGVVLEQVRGRLGVPAARILLHDQVERVLRFGASRGIAGARPRSLRIRLGEGPAGRAALERETVVLSGEPLAAAGVDTVDGEGEEPFRGYLAMPLVAKGRLQGVLETFHRDSVPAEHDWLEFLRALAVQAAIALDSASMFERLERSNIELKQAYDTTIEGWARALDLKDEDTVGHSRRVTDLSVQLAARLGLGGDQLVQVRRGALLHDIGKMGVPDHILLKPGSLDPDEWEVMKRHTTFAYDLLSSIPFLRPALDIPYAHHERWDGNGYPRGLRGEEIPLAARLFSVVDVYDALTSERPYREAWTEDEALAHIEEGAGSQFDPQVVEAFLEMITERRASA